MLLIALIACIIMSTGSFAWGYWQAGYEEASRWIIVFGIVWLLAQWRRWKWFSAPAVLIALLLAMYGIWFKFIYGLMFSGVVFGVFAWDLSDFQQKLKLLSPREDVHGMTVRHLLRVGMLVLASLLITAILLSSGKR